MSDSSDIQAQIVGVFFEECDEGLATIESGFLELDVENPDEEEINRIFRALHSIKGSSGSFGFSAISQFAHHAETLLDEIRAGERRLDANTVNLFLKGGDHIREMVDAAREGTEIDSTSTEELAEAFRSVLASQDEAAAGGPEHLEVSEQMEATDETRWRICFEPHGEILQTGNDPIRILRCLSELGSLDVRTDLSALPKFDLLDSETCFATFNLSLSTPAPREEIEDVFSWVEDECNLTIEEVPISAAGSSLTPSDSATPNAPAQPKAENETTRVQSSIRVSTDKVDALINMVGELVIIQSMLSDIGENPEPEKLGKLREGLAQLQHNTRELQERVMRIRMLPISFAFNRFPRLVHDLSEQLGKKIDLAISGEGTELDKNVLEKIGDPLVHLVRNALDHGLEEPEERIASGKPETGKIELNAFHRGGNVFVEIKDDGRGLDVDRIRAKALERGLISTDEVLTEERIHQLILEPGFSTADSISDVSGRGVGMDVVCRNVKALGGTIEVASITGVGSTFTVRLPLTLAILDGQLVRVGDEVFVIPLISIIESLQVREDATTNVAGRADVYRLRDEAVPILRLSQIFDVCQRPRQDPDEKELMVVVEHGNAKAGLLVDELLGQQQVVIKSLENNYQAVEGFAGATILGDGTVALILDVAGVLNQASKTTPGQRTPAADSSQGLTQLTNTIPLPVSNDITRIGDRASSKGDH